METRIAVMGIIVENTDSVEALNSALHDYGKYIISSQELQEQTSSASFHH